MVGRLRAPREVDVSVPGVLAKHVACCLVDWTPIVVGLLTSLSTLGAVWLTSRRQGEQDQLRLRFEATQQTERGRVAHGEQVRGALLQLLRSTDRVHESWFGIEGDDAERTRAYRSDEWKGSAAYMSLF